MKKFPDLADLQGRAKPAPAVMTPEQIDRALDRWDMVVAAQERRAAPVTPKPAQSLKPERRARKEGR